MSDLIYSMILRDFRAFPGMWANYVQRNMEDGSPIRAVSEALARDDADDALREFSALDESVRSSTRGQVARAMIDFARH